MVAVVVAVLFAIQPQHIVQAKLFAQHRRHLPRDHPGGAARAHQPQVFRRHTRQVARVVQRTGQEVLVFPQPALVPIVRKAVALAQGHALGALQDAFIAPALRFKVSPRGPRRAVALDAVGLAHGHGAVVQAVVQRLRERQDVLDLHLFAQQHGGADLHTAVGAASVGHVKAQLFPQDPFLDVAGAHALGADAQGLGNALADAGIAALVFGLLLLRLLLLFAALLQVARQLHHDLCRAAIAADQGIDHHPHLVQADMHRGVGNLAVALFVVARLVFGKGHMALQCAAVVGQLFEGIHGLDFASGWDGALAHPLYFVAVVVKVKAQVAVVRKPGGLHRLVIGHHIALQLRHDARQRLAAQAAVALGQGYIGNGLGPGFVHPRVLLQPGHQRAFAFFVHDLPDDLVLQLWRKACPGSTQQVFARQGCAGGVAFEFSALGILQIKLHRTRQLQQLANLVKAELVFGLQRRHHRIALGQRQRHLAQRAIQQAQVVHLLQDAKALCTGQGQRCALLIGQQGAAARAHGAQRALVQQRVAQVGPRHLCEQRGLQRCLCRPQRIELLRNHGAIHVQVVAFVDALFALIGGVGRFTVACPHALPGNPFGPLLHAHLPKPFAHRLATAGRHAFAQLVDGLFERAAVVVLAVGLAVALKAPALVDVEQRAGKLAGCQRLAQALGPQLIGVEPLQRLARRLVSRKEPVAHQLAQHAGFALEQPVTAAAHGTGSAAGDGQGRPIFGVAAIAEDAHA